MNTALSTATSTLRGGPVVFAGGGIAILSAKDSSRFTLQRLDEALKIQVLRQWCGTQISVVTLNRSATRQPLDASHHQRDRDSHHDTECDCSENAAPAQPVFWGGLGIDIDPIVLQFEQVRV